MQINRRKNKSNAFKTNINSSARVESRSAVIIPNAVKNALKITNIQIQAWTDSTIVLCWLADHPSRWKTFVAKRVAEIQTTLPSCVWRHVESTQNPADCASRGLTRSELEAFDLWWTGPSFLLKNHSKWPANQEQHTCEQPLEEKKQIVMTLTTVESFSTILEQFSNFKNMLKAMARCLRWIRSRHDTSLKLNLSIQTNEILKIEQILIRIVQLDAFHTEIACIAKNQPLPAKSSIHNLDPYIDSSAILRVGGRIQLSTLAEHKKHPIILPAKHRFTVLLITHAHHMTLHGGYSLTAQYIRQQFWIINARVAIKSIIYKCMTCFRFRKQLLTQKMGNIPAYRLQQAVPFAYAGVDYAGYFEVKSSQRRNAPYVKCYIALFICLTTRAIHLELVSDLSTVQFMKAFRRFISRRGIPNHMFSDNATNFTGAEKEIATGASTTPK